MISKLHAASILVAVIAVSALAGDLGISDGWVRESIPGQDRSAAYLRLTNSSGQDCRLTAVESPAAGRVEIHEHRHREGRMQMRRLEALTLPAGETVVFQPGGLHLMLLDLNRPLKSGERVSFSFDAGACGSPDAELVVRGME